MIDTEQQAIAALRRGDIKGLETLVGLYQLRSLRAAYAITGDRHSAEDVVADAFLSVYDHIEQFDERRPFAPWFYRIVANGALKAVRKGNRISQAEEEGPELGERVDTTPGPEEAAALREMRLLILDAVRALPPEQRAALVLRYYLDMDERTIGQTLSCPLGTVKWRLHAARERLRRSLVPEFGTLAPDASTGETI